jgi:hypothetical protein
MRQNPYPHREHHAHQLICTCCAWQRVAPARSALGYTTCLDCGEKAARQVKHASIPLSKSNYYYVSGNNLDFIKQTNPKRTQS